MTIQISPMSQGFGAQVSGFDPQCPTSPQHVESLQAAFAAHHMLVFSDCGLISPERQVEIVGWFGRTDADSEVVTSMDNAMAAGRAVLPFHCDITFFRYPFEGISLHPLELPATPTSTTYVSNAVAWDTLPAATQALLRERKVRHFFEDNGQMGFDIDVYEYWHPACLPHYRTERPLLFVTEHHVDAIEGLTPDESKSLLADLFAHLYAPERRYEHVWRHGDLVIWDNYAIQHSRTREADPRDGKRVLQRVAFGEHGFAGQLEELLQAAR